MTELEQLAVRIATEMKLKPALVLAICKIESSWNPWAIRYEPAFEERYIKPMNFKPVAPCSMETERKARATSFGLMQMMGQNTRNMGFNEPFLTALCDPTVNIRYGCVLLKKLVETYEKLDGVISAYNAGHPTVRNQIYVRKVKEAMADYEKLLSLARD